MYLIYKLLKGWSTESKFSNQEMTCFYIVQILMLDQDRTNFFKEIIIKFLNVFTYL